MDIIFQAMEDIEKGSYVKLDFETGELSTITNEEMKLQPEEKPNIIETEKDPLDDLLI